MTELKVLNRVGLATDARIRAFLLERGDRIPSGAKWPRRQAEAQAERDRRLRELLEEALRLL